MVYSQLLVKGADTLLLNLYNTHIKEKPIIPTQKNTMIKDEMEVNECGNVNNEEFNIEDLNNFTLTQSQNEDGLIFTECANKPQVYYIVHSIHLYLLDFIIMIMDNLLIFFQGETKEPTIVIQQYKKNGDFLSLPHTLGELQPKYIIMYDANMTAVRQIEVLFICFQKISI